jgi:predicted dehydrogenase
MDLHIQPPLPEKRDFRIGILGSGFVVNECHLPAYRKAGFNPVAIASRNRQNAAQTAQRHGIPKVHDSYEDLLNDPSIEVLDIAVAPQGQLDLIRRACERKTVRGILAQKPLGINYMEAVTAALLCKEAGLVLSVNQNMRYDQSVRAAKTLLQNGVIGQPVFATIEMRGIPHWMPWQAELGWATLRIMSIHHLDCFRYWFGGPEGIYCSVRTDPRTKFAHADGICSYIIDYANGLRCVGIDDPWTGPAKEGCPADIYLRWRIEGLNGLAIGDIGWCHDPYTTPSTIKFASKGDACFHEPKWTESWFPDAFIGTMAQLLIALETGTEPAISAADNLKTMALVEAAYKSTKGFFIKEFDDLNAPEKLAALEPKKPGLLSKLFSKPSVSPGRPVREASLNNFTPRAQQALALARKEADRLNHNFVGTEHVLLGLIALNQGVACSVLRKLGLDLESVRMEVKKQVGAGPEPRMTGDIPFTPLVKKVLLLAGKKAKNLNDAHVGTEHILLALLQEGDGVAARVLKNLNVDAEQARREILKELDPKICEVTENLGESGAEKARSGSPAHSTTPASAAPLTREEAWNFTPRAQQVLALARKEASRFNHNFVGTEHVLLGLIALNQGVAVTVLKKLGVRPDTLRMDIEKQIGTGPEQRMTGIIPYTPRVKKALALAAKEAKELDHTYVGTGHILLGLLREGDGVAARVLKNLDIYIDQTRREILKEFELHGGEVTEKLSESGTGKARVSWPAASNPTASPGPLTSEEAGNFTPRAQQVLRLARKEAERLHHILVGAEHLLLGVIALGNGVAANVLLKLGLDSPHVRAEVEKQVGSGAILPKETGNMPYNPRVKEVLALAAKEARNLNHTYVGTEHILLGLLREGDGRLPHIFKAFGVDVEKTRLEILKELDPNFGK